MKKNVPISAFPNYTQSKNYAFTISKDNLDVENHCFDFYKPYSKKINCQFHILFFTAYRDPFYKFVGIDVSNGKIYHIFYEPRDAETDAQIKEIKELDSSAFVDLLNSYEKFLPGVVSMFGNYSQQNWREYLSISYPQVLSAACLLIRREHSDCLEYLFNDGLYGLDAMHITTTHCVCSKTNYNLWKADKTRSTDDLLFFSQLLKLSDNVCTKKHGLFSGRKITRAIARLKNVIDQNLAITEHANSHGNISVFAVKNGLYTHIANNISIPDIDEHFANIIDLL